MTANLRGLTAIKMLLFFLHLRDMYVERLIQKLTNDSFPKIQIVGGLSALGYISISGLSLPSHLCQDVQVYACNIQLVLIFQTTALRFTQYTGFLDGSRLSFLEASL